MKRISLAVMVVAISTLVCLTSVGVVAADGSESYWVWENPTPTGNGLSDVYCLDADHAWAVGAEGTILFYDGVRWNPQISPTTSNLEGVWAVGASDVWAVGEAGTVVHYDGTSWQLDADAITHSLGKNLHAVAAFDASNVIAVGDSGTALHYNGSDWSEKSIPDGHNQHCVTVLDAGNAWSGGTYGRIYYFNGTSWSFEYHASGLLHDTEKLHGICAKATDEVWAVGDIGTIVHKGPSGWEDKTGILHHIFQGANMFDIDVLGTSDLFIVGSGGKIFRGELPIINVIKVPSGTSNSLQAVSIHNLLAGWAVGDNGTILFHDGISWNHQDSNVNIDFSGVSALSADSAWAVGDYGSIFHYDSAMWVPQDSGTRKDLYDVFALDSTHVWAVGDGTILFYDGNTWSEEEHTLLSPKGISGTSSDFVLAVGDFEIHRFNGDRWVLDHITSHRLNGVYAFTHDGNNCAWAVGDNGHALYYDGTSWTDHPTGDTHNRNLMDVIAFGPDQAWAVGQKGVIYNYDGSWHDETWSDEVTLNSITALSSNAMWAAGDDETILYNDGVSGWVKQHHGSTHLGGICAASSKALWAVGDDEKVLFLDDAGSSSWKDVSPSHTTAKLNGVSAADDANVWAVGEKGTILHYDGLIWLAQDSGTTKDLYGVSAFDASHVWAVGDSGTILHYNGSVWQAQNSGTTKKIYGVAAMAENGACAVGDDYAYFYSSAGWKAVKGGFNGKGVAGTDMNHLWAVCGNHDVWSYNSGTESWTQHKGVTDKNLYGIAAAAVSGNPAHLWAVGDDGRIIFSDDGGSSWPQESSGTTDNLKSVSALDKDNVWAVGQKGTILRRGSGWEAQTSTTQLDLYGVSALASRSVWAVGDKGQCDTILAAYPGIESCSPQTAPRGHKLEVDITGGNTNFRQYDSTVAFSGGGISVEWVEVTDARHLRAKISIASDADLSARDLNVITGGEEPYTLTGALTVYDLSISEITPTAGVWGETGLDVHIYGNGTAFDGTSYAEFKPQTGLFDDITVNSTTCVSPTEVVANIDIAAGASERLYNVHVKTVGEQYEPLPLDGAFTICDSKIQSVSPSSFARGHTVDVVITGYETQFIDGQSTAVFEPSDGITVNSITYGGPTEVTANITIAAGAPATYREVNVTTTAVPDPHPLKRGFKVRNPVIDGASPSKGVQGQSLVMEVMGLETAFVDGQSYATFDPPDGIIVVDTVVWTEHLASVIIDIDLTATIAPRDVNVITPCSGVPAEETPQPLAGGLNIISAAPHIDLITANGAVGDEILIQGYNFGFLKGSSYVTFNGVDATDYTHWSTGEIKVKVPPGATTGPLTVTTIYGTSNAMGFTVTPKIDGLDPILGPVGTAVTVTGTTFGDTQGTSYVEVGGIQATGYTSWADGEIVVSVPPGATSGPVTVTTPDGTSNAVDFTVTHSTWYFAEGCTTGGFETWILVENPDPQAVKVYISFYTPEGLFAPAALQGVEIPAEARVTFNAGAYIQDTHLSSVVSSEGGQVFCERSMYGGERTWGHNSIGATFPASTWYLAEGSTEGGMETWILVQNTDSEPVEVELEFQTEKGKVPGPKETLPGHTRRSFNAAEYVQSYDVSTLVTASGGVVCERSMYGGDRTWGHNSIGTPMTSQTWYLAEGCAEAGMETWILVQNPGDEEVAVDLTFHTAEGEVEGPTGVIPPRSRQSFLVNEFVTSFHVSTLVTASGGVVCERSMYGNGRTWGHNSIGITAPDNAWHLVEGCTEGGMETWVLVQNPGDDEVQVQLTFRTGAGETQGPEATVPARSRYTFNVGEFVQSYDVATLVTASGGVVCERSMYGNDRTWAHNSIGFAP